MTKTQEKSGLKFKCGIGELSEALRMVKGAMPARTTLPVLLNVLVESEGDGIRVSATNFDLHASFKFPTEVGGMGKSAVNFSRLSDFLSGMSDGDVEISVNEGKAVVKAGRSRLSMTSIDADDFPKSPEIGEVAEFTVMASDLYAVMQRIMRAVSVDKARGVLNGAFIKIGGDKLELVATDGKRLAQATCSCSGPSGEFKAIIPSRTIQELESILSKSEDKVMMLLNSNGVMFRFGGLQLFSKLVEGEFPTYEQIIPKKSEHIIVVDAPVLLASVKRTAICAESLVRSIKVKITSGSEGMIVLESANQSADMREEIPCSYEGDGVELALDHLYVQDALAAFGEGKVRIGINSSLTPILFTPENREGNRQVVMPMRA